MKKAISILLSLCLVTAFTACGNKNSTKTNANNGGKIKITFWHTTPIGDPGYAKINNLVKQFNNSQDKVEVKQIGYSFWDYWDKLNIVVAAKNGNAPDIGLNTLDNSISRADAGLIYDLSPLIKRDNFNLGDFYQNQIDFGTYKGDIYSLPFTSTTRVLYYNLDLFQKAGLTEADVPKTWDELSKVAKQLDKVDASGNIQVMGFDPTAGDATYHGWLWTKGLDFFDAKFNPTLDDSQHEEVLRWMRDFNKNFTPKQKQGFGEANKLIGLDPFTAGRMAMYIGSDALHYTLTQKKVNFKYGVASIPIPEGGTRVNWGSGFSLEMFNNGDEKKKEAAWEFYKYLMSPDVQKQYYEISGWLMSNKKAMEEPAKNDKILSRIVEELPYAKDKVFVDYAPAWHANDWQQFYTRALNPEKDDVRQALKDAQKYYLQKRDNFNTTRK